MNFNGFVKSGNEYYQKCSIASFAITGYSNKFDSKYLSQDKRMVEVEKVMFHVSNVRIHNRDKVE